MGPVAHNDVSAALAALHEEPSNLGAGLPTAVPLQSDLGAAASYLQSQFASKAYSSRREGAEALGCSMKQVAVRLEAAAEASWQHQVAVLHDTLQYVRRMKGTSLHPIGFIERQSYDNTDAELRVPAILENSVGQRVKLMMIETEWAMLVRQIASDTEGHDVASNGDGRGAFLLIRGKLSPAARIVERGTAECARNALLSVQHLVEDAHSIFDGKVFRIAECDEHSANLRAERLLTACRPSPWQDATLVCICAAHKAHSSAERTWQFCLPLLTGMTNTSRALMDIEVLKHIKEQIKVEIEKRLVIDWHPKTDVEATHFREHAMALFLPPPSQPRRRARMEEACALLNGNWTKQRVLIHHCHEGCCGSRAECIAKLQRCLPKALMSQRPTMFAKNNWSEWSLQSNFYGWSFAIHGFLRDIVSRVLMGQHEQDVALQAQGLIPSDPPPEVEPMLQPLAEEGRDRHLDEVAKARAEKARWVKVACEWLPTSWPAELWILRASLQSEVKLMKQLLHLSSDDYVIMALHQRLSNDIGDFPVKLLSNGKLVQDAVLEAMRQMQHPTLFAHLAETEKMRSDVFKYCLRAVAVLSCLLGPRHTTFPWKLFSLLDPEASAEGAAALLEARCMQDAWSQRFLNMYSTAEALAGEECRQLLCALSALIQGTTFSTERLHSSNTRRSKHRVQAKRMDVSTVALKHAAFASDSVLRRMMQPVSGAKKRRGRRKKQLKEDRKVGGKRQRTSKLGSWRAYIHVAAAGEKLSANRIRHLSGQYQNLPASERERFKLLSDLGALSSAKTLVTQLPSV